MFEKTEPVPESTDVDSLSLYSKEYIHILETALAAAIVTLFDTHKDDCMDTFTMSELARACHKTKDLPEGTSVEGLYAKALRFPKQYWVDLENRSKQNHDGH